MYEFKSEKELDEFFNKAKSIESLDSLLVTSDTYFLCKRYYLLPFSG